MKLVKLAALATLVLGSQAFAQTKGNYTSSNNAAVSATVQAKVEFVNPLEITSSNIDYGAFLINKVATGNIIKLDATNGDMDAPTDSDVFTDDHKRGEIEVSGWDGTGTQGNGDANDFTGAGYVSGVRISVDTITGDMASGGALEKTLNCSFASTLVPSCTADYDVNFLSTTNSITWDLGGEILIKDRTKLLANVYTQDFVFTADYY